MRTSDRRALNGILQHKDYFDLKLIEISIHLDSQVKIVTTENKGLRHSNQLYKKKNTTLHLKNSDLKIQKHNADQKYLQLKKERDEILKYMEELQKELDNITKENNQQRKEIDRQRKEIEKQEKTINDYSSQLDKLRHMNSTNSNLPSSMDILGRTKAKAQSATRVKSDCARG